MGLGRGGMARPGPGAHLPQLEALLLELLQGSSAGLLLLHEREHVAVEAGREDRWHEWDPGGSGLCGGWRLSLESSQGSVGDRVGSVEVTGRGSPEDKVGQEGTAGAWAQGRQVASPPKGSPVSDLSDLLPDLLAPVGDEEGHPRCRLTLPEWGPVYPEVWALPSTGPQPGGPQSTHRHRVLQLLLRLPEAGDEEAAAGPPEQALQGGSLVGFHGTCHKAAAGQAGRSCSSLPCIALPGHPEARPCPGRSTRHIGPAPREKARPTRLRQSRRNPYEQGKFQA